MTSTGMMRSVDRALSVGAPLMGSITPEGARKLENHCVSVKGAEGQSDFFLGGDGRGGARVRASRERRRERREGRTSSASRKASRKKESEGKVVRAMVVSEASVSYTRVCEESCGSSRRDARVVVSRHPSWFARGRFTCISDASDASRSDTLDLGLRRGGTRSKLPETCFLDR